MSNETVLPRRLNQSPLPKGIPNRGEDQRLKALEGYVEKQQAVIDRMYDQLVRVISERHGAGTLAERPPAGVKNRTYLVTDAPERLSIDDGTAWFDLFPGAAFITTTPATVDTTIADATDRYEIVLVDPGAPGVDITVGLAANNANHVVVVKNVDPVLTIHVQGTGGEQIDGAASQAITAGDSLTIAPGTGEWFIV